ncbi:SMP-30/gluconolactonase/LRE family protein [Nocardioides bruguierae]|uniref:SMP-30/gluconolactonase/LRE family protein n=1 Tax=Nocardioides bruguierae TaxID=2945102 RepID=UPI002020E7EC|nr:SMP-30/gluconolactonase/LRE family protein [Nocardioides bruguierae]MCL8025382.1 SMP-30/gluconolactonase/LRE family protein [Nocardioides bruguierae]
MLVESVATPLTDVVTHHGEGPVWDEAGTLRCVDLLAGDVLTVPLDGSAPARRHLGDVAAVWRPRTRGGAVVAREHDLVLLAADGSVEQQVSVVEDRQAEHGGIRLNEGGCDPAGRFWVGSMPYDETRPAGTLYRVDPDLTVTAVLGGLTIPNGLAWSADGRVAFHADSPTRVVSRLVVDEAGDLVEREPWLDLDALDVDGYPDGLTVDAAGGVWVALWGAGCVVRCEDAPGGPVATHRVRVPASQTSAVALEPGGTRLAITTSAKQLAPGAEPLAGALFTARAPFPGVPVRPFAG